MTAIERRIKEIAKEEGLLTTEIIFEVVPARRMIEAMAYHFPTNYSHWTFGRDYDRIRTIYEHTGGGIPYEVVWNFETPRAFLVASNPFALNVLTIAHVYGHVDHFLRNSYFKHGRSFGDIAEEARYAADKFRHYESVYGREEVERLLDSAISIQWQQHPDPFYEEQDEEQVRAYLIRMEMEKLSSLQQGSVDVRKAEEGRIRACETRLKELRHKTPPEPVFDIQKYIIDHAPRLEDWERDVLTLFRNQARALAPNRRIHLLAEAFAVRAHTRIMRRLFEEKLLTAEEHGVYNTFHSKVTQASRGDLNVYHVGPALLDYVEMCWDKGRFGKEYEECTNLKQKERWDTGAMQGRAKIFEIADRYTDRMAVEEFFTDEFIHGMQLYFYEGELDEETDEIVYTIVEDDPAVIRHLLKSAYTLYDIPLPAVVDGNHNDRGELYLRHYYNGRELLPQYRNGVLMQIGYQWRRPVHLETVTEGKTKLFSYDGSKHMEQQLLIFPGK